MSSLRPGTVDYSKWDHLDASSSSDDESSEGGDKSKGPPLSWLFDGDDEEGGDELSGDEECYSEEYGDEASEYDSEYDVESCDPEVDGSEGSKEDEEEKDQAARPRVTRPTTNHTSSTSTATTNKVPAAPAPSLATLQKAWKVTTTTTTTPEGDDASSGGRVDAEHAAAGTGNAATGNAAARACASCSRPGPPFRCSRCQMVWFCSATCQRDYHPIHKKECVNAAEHFRYWGCLLGNDTSTSSQTASPTSSGGTQKTTQQRFALENALAARIALRRKRALKQAAAAAAVKRARLAREARGQPTKGGGGKNGGKGPAEQKEEMCSVCQCEFTIAGDAGAGLCCPASHFMCNECAGVYCSSVLADLHVSYPPKCPMCRALLPEVHFEAQLTPKQLSAVKAHAAETALQPGQVLAKCKECNHFDVEQEPGSVVWWCDACGFGTCFVCHQDLPRNVVKYNLETSPHAICQALRVVKLKIEQAIAAGSQMQCPSCGLAGRKDDACTHMSCPKCATEWCYVCGLSVVDCDKAPARDGRPANDIYLHNRDWEINEKRCPMYLTQILEVDLSWLGEDWENRIHADEDFEDDEKCLDYFHRFRTIQKLQEVMNEVGQGDFQAAFENFESINNAGYSLEEIITTCTDHLIDRADYLQQVEEEEDQIWDNDDDERAEEEDGVDLEEEEFEDVPEEMTSAVLQEEEGIRLAIQASLGEEPSNMETGDVGDDNEEGEEGEFEEVPEEMTTAIVQEEQHMHRATEASRVSAQEDELFRRVLAESTNGDRE